MELIRAMRTTPATRSFTDDDLPDELLYEILDSARFAPNGGNRQAWRVIVLRDPAVKAEIARLYNLGMREYAAHVRAGLVPFVASEAHSRTEPAVDLEAARRGPVDEVDLMAERGAPVANAEQTHIASAPVLLVILLDLTDCSAVDSGLDRLSISAGASVYPFAHNVLLAARDHGFGGHLTSVVARQEPALRELLGIPSNFALATVIPLGRPTREITKLSRQAVENFTTVARFDGPGFARP